MDLYKKLFIEQGTRGIVFIVCGVGLQFSEKFSDIIFGIYIIISLVLIISLTVIHVISKKKRSKCVDELAKINMLKAESVLYKTIIFFGLGFTFFIHVFLKDEFQIVLNWYIFMIIFGCCDLAYCFFVKFFEGRGEALSE